MMDDAEDMQECEWRSHLCSSLHVVKAALVLLGCAIFVVL